MHMYTQPHTHAHETHKYAYTFMHTHTHTHTHNTLCTQKGYSPLHIASQEGHDQVVEILLQAGATVDLQKKVENFYLLICNLCCGLQTIHCTLDNHLCAKVVLNF